MVNENLNEGELVLCTVEKIVGTTVFVKIDGNGEGTITTSEIAPGRIRNLRDYVVPGKKIVCLILSIKGERIHLSLRRVGLNEKKDFLQKVEREKSYIAILKTILGEEETEKTIKKILEKYSILEFFEKIKNNPPLLNEYIEKEKSEKILKIIELKKEKPKKIKQIFKLSSKDSDGIKKIKEIIQSSCKNHKCSISYIAAGKYSIEISGENLKKIRNEIKDILEEIEKLAKKNKCEFSFEKT
ncbi:MAG: hypothetical protein QXW97_01955 [Candidatus Pacearchaeota archaeon]